MSGTSSKRLNSRRKGQSAERRLVKLFEVWWDAKFFRTPGSGAFATRGFAGVDTSSMAGDIVTPDQTFPFCVESKKVEGWTLEQMLTSDKTHMHKWWDQAVEETPQGKIPLLVFTKNHAPLYAMMRVEDMSGALDLVTYKNGFQCMLREQHVRVFALSYLLTSPKTSWIYAR
jgi:hypothetical protein